jgi:hypothetical protein
VKWLGYPVGEATWEPVKHLEYVRDMIRAYEKQAGRDGQLGKTHPIHKPTKEGRKDRSNEEKSENSRPSTRQRGRPRKSKQPETISIEDSEEEQEEGQSQIDPQAVIDADEAEVEGEGRMGGSEAGVQGEKAGSGGGMQEEDSLDFSDVSDTIEVVSLRVVSGVRYYQVRFPHAIKWVSNDKMRRDYARELICFYEKFVNLS